MKRLFDIFFSICALLILSPFMVAAAVMIQLSTKGPILYWSERVGRHGKMFMMPKFRTMCPSTPKMATADVLAPKEYLTPIGSFLRKTSIDELPQFYSILAGHMSVVGPRPVIRNERSLLKFRKESGVDKLLPGLTGWAQINGRDQISARDKARFDEEYLHNQSLLFDLFIIVLTTKRFFWDRSVSH